ncbi:hypothetical protein [Moorena sp. SIO4G3]|uniref:hypothetical protein n=1 Tax=Moorena sp. SIO4G3 TaxID=2607821 RepID=UPI00142A773C|nr:hypothetical protein [Moorena sp. SIO4G3]NEO79876.1 hypothetical protein [Moorena sp. SIO4G3]
MFVSCLAAFQAPAIAAVETTTCEVLPKEFCKLEVESYGDFNYVGAHLDNQTDENCLLSMFQTPKKQYFFYLSPKDARTIDLKFDEAGKSAILTNRRPSGSNCTVNVEYHVELRKDKA